MSPLPHPSIRDKYRLDLTAPITRPICRVLGCWQRCPASHMSSCGGGGGVGGLGCKMAACHGSCVRNTLLIAKIKPLFPDCRRRAEPPMAFIPSRPPRPIGLSDRTGSLMPPDCTSDTPARAHAGACTCGSGTLEGVQHVSIWPGRDKTPLVNTE